MGFIYKVTNKINNKVYVGKTCESIEKRFMEHIQEAKTNDKNRPFHKALNKYGSENFYIEQLEEIESNKLDEREKYWIQKENSYIGFQNSNGYNATLGGDGALTYDYRLIIEDYLLTKSKTQTAKNFNCCVETVTKACNDYNIKTISKASGVKILRISLEGEEKSYTSIRQAAEELALILNKNSQTIRKRITYVIRHKPEQKAYGYYWKELKI